MSLVSKNLKEETIKENVPVKSKTVTRDNTAALLANLDDSDSDEDDSETGFSFKSKGIYSSILNNTKKELKNTQQKFEIVEKNLLAEKENIVNENSQKQKINESKQNNSNNNDTDSDSSGDEPLKSFGSPIKKLKKKEKSLSPAPSPSSPPPPVVHKQKRKSSNIIDKQLKELEKISFEANKNMQQTDCIDVSLNSSNHYNFDDELNTITVRVSAQTGVHKWEIKMNQPFLTIYENLSKIEKTNIENLLLTLKDKKIAFHDTPESINLKIYDLIDCAKSTGKANEKIKIVENDDEKTPENMLKITLQTQDGRKSRITFLISKSENFKNVLKKYCEKRELGNMDNFMIEFDGEKVDLDETPTDLDIDGGEIFDVKRNSKPSLEQVKENKNNYEFDDDILTL